MNTEKKGLSEAVLLEVAAMYGLKVASFGAVEGGYRNLSHSFLTSDGQNLNFILYKHEPDSISLIRRVNKLGSYVAMKGLPARRPYDERIIKVGRRYGSLYEYLPGQTIPWESYSMKHIKLLGYALAEFHTAAEDFEGNLPNVEDVYTEITGRMKKYFADKNIVRAIEQKLGVTITLPDFPSLLGSTKKLTERNVLHMDFVRSNLLFSENGPLRVGSVAMSGILDLEKAARGHKLFDIARTLAFLLVDCPKPAEKTYKYFLDSGYRKRGGGDLKLVKLNGDNLLEQLVTMFLAYDFYKFLRQNPYESLAENHHFKRTERILRERKVLQ